jgi:hypothetical protein
MTLLILYETQITIKRSYKMSEIEIIKHDVLKLINKVEELEQMIINLTYKRKEEEKNND